jgi:hypothetical protein
MSHPMESYEKLHRSWDERIAESISLRKLFWMALLSVFVAGLELGAFTIVWLRFHRYHVLEILNLLVFAAVTFRYCRAIYRRLPND